MNRFIKKAFSASLVFGLLVVMGVLVVLAEPDYNAGVHTLEIGISVYSPITDMMDCEIAVNIQSMLAITAPNAAQMRMSDNGCIQCEDALAVHQERIDSIIALMCEHGIDNLHDLSVLLQSSQNQGCCALIVPFGGCPGGCYVVPVWVTINGVRHPGFLCMTCGRIIIL